MSFKNLFLFTFLLIFSSALANGNNPKNVVDSTQIANGAALFNQNCSTCHNFKTDGIGPQLGGVSEKVSQDWLKDFIKNAGLKINAGDKRGIALQKKFKTTMPSFDYLDEESIASIIAFIGTNKAPKVFNKSINAPELLDPIPQKIKMSDLVLNIESYTSIPYSSENQLHTRIAKMDFQPESHDNYILDLRGTLYQIKDRPIEYLNMAKYMPKFINVPGLATGFGSFAFHPDFAKNGLLYTTHTEAAGSASADFAYADSIKVALQWVVSEWKTDEPNAVPFKGTQREMFRVNMVNVIHGVQDIAFNPNSKKGNADYGLLYIGIGDGGCVEQGYPTLPHNLKRIWGTIIRIDPAGKNSRNGKYGIPNTNPFAKTNNLGEIYAYGFRNPHRITWTKGGKMLASNIGQKMVESINMIMPGHDYGWPEREGTFRIDSKGDINHVYKLLPNDKKYNYTYPVIQIDHDEINAISGGFEYQGKEIPALIGKYVFGSIVDGRLFYTEEKDLQNGKQAEIREWRVAFGGKPIKMNELTHNDRVDLRIGKDQKGELYLMTKPDGKVYKLLK